MSLHEDGRHLEGGGEYLAVANKIEQLDGSCTKDLVRADQDRTNLIEQVVQSAVAF